MLESETVPAVVTLTEVGRVGTLAPRRPSSGLPIKGTATPSSEPFPSLSSNRWSRAPKTLEEISV